jgi:flagellar hook-associated protein 3 FlgL
MRVSANWLSLRMLSQIQRSQSRMVESQAHVATGKRINTASDDPSATGRVLALLTRADNTNQYQRNVALAGQDLAATEAAVTAMHNLLARAHELSVQASGGALSAEERSKIGVEVQQLIAEAVSVANRQHGDRYLFAGHRTSTKPFTEDVPGNPAVVTYNGDVGVIEREIAQGERVQVNVTGVGFIPNALANLITFRDALNTNNLPVVRAATGTLKTSMDDGLSVRSQIGARVTRVESAGQRHEDEWALVETMRSNLQDVDLSKAIVELETHETAYQAALAATGRTLQISLIDFLR